MCEEEEKEEGLQQRSVLAGQKVNTSHWQKQQLVRQLTTSRGKKDWIRGILKEVYEASLNYTQKSSDESKILFQLRK